MWCKNCQCEYVNESKFCRLCGTALVASEGIQNNIDSQQVTKILGAPKLSNIISTIPRSPQLNESSQKEQDLLHTAIPIANKIHSGSSSVSLERNEQTKISLSKTPIAPPTNVLVGPFCLAGFWLRFAALMFDFVVYIIWFFAWWFLAVFYSNVYPSISIALQWIAILGVVTFLLLNLVLLPIRCGQTFGKWVVGIRIVQSNFSKVKPSSILKRHTIGYLVSIPFFTLGFVWVLWDRYQQGWHDKIANTLVVRIDDQ